MTAEMRLARLFEVQPLGYTKSLKTALGAQTYLGEIKSTQRDKAVAFNSDKYRYY